MSLNRLALLSTLLSAARAAAPTTVLGFPEMQVHNDLQILGTSGDSTTYKLELPPIEGAPAKEIWTVTYSPSKIVGHGELEVGPGAKDIVDRSCAVVKQSVLAACAQSLSGTGLTPEEQAGMAEENKLGEQPIPTEGADAVLLVPLNVGSNAGPAPGAAPGAALGPEATGRPMAGPPEGNGMGGMGGMGGPAAPGGEGGSGSPKGKKPEAGGDTSSPVAGGAPPPASATTTKAPKVSGGPPPVSQTGSGATRPGVGVAVPLFLLGFVALFVL